MYTRCVSRVRYFCKQFVLLNWSSFPIGSIKHPKFEKKKVIPMIWTQPNIECLQNCTAPEVFVQSTYCWQHESKWHRVHDHHSKRIVNIVLSVIFQSFLSLLLYIIFYVPRSQCFEKVNEMLTNFNARTISLEVKEPIQMDTVLRKDLDSMFKGISIIRAKIKTQYLDYQKSNYPIVLYLIFLTSRPKFFNVHPS